MLSNKPDQPSQTMKTTTPIRSFFATLAIAFTALPSDGAQEPLFEGLGSYKRKVTTDSPKARRYFNQGVAFLHGFNHGAAIRSFREAARLDPECAMAHWGIAIASGPHINFPFVPPSAAELAWKELQLARKYRASSYADRTRFDRSARHTVRKSAARGPKPFRSRLCGGHAQSVAGISRMIPTSARCSPKP